MTTLPDPPSILAAVRALDPSHARVIKRDGHAEVLAAVVAGVGVIIKRWTARSPADALKMAVRCGRADRHARGAARLRACGVPTAAVLARETTREQGRRTQVLVLEKLAGKTVLEHLADGDLSPRTQHAIARRIALDMAAMLRQGFYNRDHKPSNLIVTSTSASDPRTAVIDTVAIRRSGDVGAIRMLASLYIEPLGCGHPPRRALAFRVVRTLADQGLGKPYQQLWMYAANVIRNHGDPTPRIDPLRPTAEPTGNRATSPHG